MSWTVPITFVDGDPLTAAQLNVFVRDNMLETGPGKATTASRLLTSTNLNTIAERQWGMGYVATSINVTEHFPVTEDGDGNVYGPEVTVQHTGRALILYDAYIRVQVNENGGSAVYGPVFNDDHRGAVTDNTIRSGREGGMRAGGSTVYFGEPGLLKVTMGYGVSRAGDDTLFGQRRLTVFPF